MAKLDPTRPSAADVARVREVLRRAVSASCPRWLTACAEDLVQDAVLRVMRAAQRSGKELPALPASYLWRAAHSAVMDEIRKRRGGREEPLDNAPEEMADEARSPARSSEARDLRGAIDAGLAALDSPRRHAVVLYLWGFSLEETARMLSWNRKRADNMRYQGLSALRRFLSERGHEP